VVTTTQSTLTHARTHHTHHTHHTYHSHAHHAPTQPPTLRHPRTTVKRRPQRRDETQSELGSTAITGTCTGDVH